VSADLAVWEDWPGIDADSEWDKDSVFSGNCALLREEEEEEEEGGGGVSTTTEDGESVVTCIYDGVYSMVRYAESAVCASSSDWVHWKKRLCIGPSQAGRPGQAGPSYESQLQHDTAIWRDGPGGTWYALSGGCTFNGTNDNTTGAPCRGNAQLWNSTDLKSFTYVGPIARERDGPGAYWELPYLLPFDANGQPLDNYHHASASQYALMFGGSGRRNSYWVGQYEAKAFTPRGSTEKAWPAPKATDNSGAYYR
jgi:hypothetical protein